MASSTRPCRDCRTSMSPVASAAGRPGEAGQAGQPPSPQRGSGEPRRSSPEPPASGGGAGQVQRAGQAGPAGRAGQASQVIVNAFPLSTETLAALQRAYPVPIVPGRYWYDAMSGAYGVEGGPIVGQMLPGLRLGGPLRAAASRGTSQVFINGRQLTAGEKAYIELACQTTVARGRYWVDARGLGGVEGGPVSFNLGLCGPPPGQRSGGSSTRTFCDPDGSCRSTGILGSILTVP